MDKKLIAGNSFLKRINRSSNSQKVSEEQWNDWHWQVRNLVTDPVEFEQWFALRPEEKRAIQFTQGCFHFSMTPYWISLMDPDDIRCPIRRQSVPLDEELKTLAVDLNESSTVSQNSSSGQLSQVNSYQARLSIHSQCVTYCRFCPQKKVQDSSSIAYSSFRKVKTPTMSEQEWLAVEQYLGAHPEIHELILSGGEPLLLNDDLLKENFMRLRKIPSIRTLQLETRIVSVLPQRITENLVQILKEHQPFYMMIHVNHPREISNEFIQAVNLLVNAGVQLCSNTILLRDINDKPQVLQELFLSLYRLRIRPYSLVHAAQSPGVDHFRTSIASGLKIMGYLQKTLPDLATPKYHIETGGGKIALQFETILSQQKKRMLLRSPEGKVFVVTDKNY